VSAASRRRAIFRLAAIERYERGSAPATQAEVLQPPRLAAIYVVTGVLAIAGLLLLHLLVQQTSADEAASLGAAWGALPRP
jgi:hypothetical protein